MYDINSAVSLWDRLAVTRKPIIMYGMGDGAQKILDVASEKGIKISGFMASDDFVRGHSFAGFEVKKAVRYRKGVRRLHYSCGIRNSY